MKRSLIIACALLALGTGLATAGEGTSYGKGVTIETAVPIDTLVASPDDYVGKAVRVEGVVTAVCKKRGCWMELSDPDSGNGIRVKVEDGVIVFPYTSKGQKASAEGVFEVIQLTPEQVEQMKAARHGESEGEDCDKDKAGEDKQAKKKADAGCAPHVHGDKVFLIRGTGAIIQG